MAPVSWQAVVFIWVYATLWFVMNDYIKVWSYKALDAWHAWRGHPDHARA